MKLLRFGAAGHERPALLDSEGLIRDLSSVIPDVSGPMLRREAVEALRQIGRASV